MKRHFPATFPRSITTKWRQCYAQPQGSAEAEDEMPRPAGADALDPARNEESLVLTEIQAVLLASRVQISGDRRTRFDDYRLQQRAHQGVMTAGPAREFDPFGQLLLMQDFEAMGSQCRAPFVHRERAAMTGIAQPV